MRARHLALLMVLVPALVAAQVPSDTTLKVERGASRAQATWPLDSAWALALRTVPGGAVKSAELEREHGKLIYSFDVKVAGKPGIEEVNIDATNGKLIGREHEGDEDEAAESAHERTPARTHRPATLRPATPAPAHP